jgi:S1-C subfamily serine protease
MKSLLKVAVLSSLTTAAIIYVLLAWKPLGDIQHSPIISWASSSSSTATPIPEPPAGRPQFSDDELNNMEVYQKTSNGVVNITSTTMVNTFFYTIPQSGTGSGVIVDDAGHIVTNDHVIADADSLIVTLADKSTHPAKVIGDDPSNDLAVIQIDVPKDKLKPIRLGNSNDLQVGQKVLAIGNPFGLDRSLTTGIISSVGRSICPSCDEQGNRPPRGNGHAIEGIIQTDAAINPGNSGGPLLNTNGEVIGINSAIVASANGGNVGVGFAIPVDTVRRITNDLITLGYVRRPSLGIGDSRQLSDYPQVARALGVEPKGIIVLDVIPGSAAALAGIQPYRREILRNRTVSVSGDVITALDGKEMNTTAEFGAAIDRHKAGERVTITVVRGAQKLQVPLVLQEAPHGTR